MPDRMPRASGEAYPRPRRSRLLLVGLPVFVVFAAFGIIVLLAYQENARVPVGEPPLIRALAEPIKLAPEDPGGREVADQGEINDLLRDEPSPATPERVLPLPEEPRAPSVRAALQPSEQPAADAEPAVPDAMPAPDTAESAGSPDSDQAPTGGPDDAGATQEAEAALARLLANVDPAESRAETETSVPEPAAAPPVVPVERPSPPPTTEAPTTVLANAPPAPAGAEGPSTEADEALSRLLAEVASMPARSEGQTSGSGSQPRQAVAAIAPAEPTAGRPGSGGGFRIQLAAVREEPAARRAWANLVDDLGPLLGDYLPFYERAETANGVFYRIQVGPFANQQAADRMCVEVQRRNASCFVVAP